MPNDVVRCEWAGDDPFMQQYHDDEWGIPTHGDRDLFELLVLEGAQAGLSWRTVLQRREGYRAAFDPAATPSSPSPTSPPRLTSRAP